MTFKTVVTLPRPLWKYIYLSKIFPYDKWARQVCVKARKKILSLPAEEFLSLHFITVYITHFIPTDFGQFCCQTLETYYKNFQISFKNAQNKRNIRPNSELFAILFLGFFFPFKPIKIFSWGSSTAICQLGPKGSSALMLMFAEEK